MTAKDLYLSRIWSRLRRRKRRPLQVFWVSLYGEVPVGMKSAQFTEADLILEGARSFDWGVAVRSGRVDGVALWNPRTGERWHLPAKPPINLSRNDTLTTTLGPVRFPDA